jgi:hypothetical protein
MMNRDRGTKKRLKFGMEDEMRQGALAVINADKVVDGREEEGDGVMNKKRLKKVDKHHYKYQLWKIPLQLYVCLIETLHPFKDIY